MPLQRTLALALVVALTACTDATQPFAPEAQPDGAGASSGAHGPVVVGLGDYTIDLGGGVVLDVGFIMTARQTGADESARGWFRHRTELNGELIDFSGWVTCMSVDPAERRAWIGGTVLVNRSVAEPFASGEIYQQGRDIWFRVLDSSNPAEVDRTTFVGFEGGAGIITSREYCDTRPWPADNARTNPVVKGFIALVR